MKTLAAPPWALILAGGDGTRLRRADPPDRRGSASQAVLPAAGRWRDAARSDSPPCRSAELAPIARWSSSPAPTSPTTVRSSPIWRPAGWSSSRSTAARRPGCSIPLMRIADLAGDVPVAVFPSDHFVDDDVAFVRAVVGCGRRASPRLRPVVLLGIEAASPETEYGWIEPADRPCRRERVRVLRSGGSGRSRRPELAASLLSRGCLWNSFVMVGRVSAFIDLIAAGAPRAACDAFEPIRRALGSAREARRRRAGLRHAAEQVNFSERVLEPAADRLGVVRGQGCGVERLGQRRARVRHDAPHRLATRLARAGVSHRRRA